MNKHQRTRSTSRPMSVNSRDADARALKAAQGLAASPTRTDGETHVQVPAFLQPATSRRAPPVQINRQKLIAEAAYLRALGRGFAPGHELEDWLAAEQTVDAALRVPVGE
jgi:hypothetical protein